ncbi:hypothetical protein RHGRI_009844 [Rhododendron griersonianum]|uniref:Transmembrane protein 256 homolog n=1 Tax=Rhododendron griersonianum TaxID=479676 RepID=A0AAV6KGB7_9ERIC|nr:hypothetical protein RHGRI_009844 [Rhododendron griersonianum]
MPSLEKSIRRRRELLTALLDLGRSPFLKLGKTERGVAALGLGTYGAHAFKPQNPTYKEVWHTASLYHLVHTAALVAAPVTKRPNIFGGLLTTGIVAFSGTCYTVALLEDRKYSTLAPFGGFAFIAAWASLLF